jgi:hypothetical protein
MGQVFVQFWYFLRVFAILAFSGTSGKFCLYGHDYIGNKIQAMLDPGHNSVLDQRPLAESLRRDQNRACYISVLILKQNVAKQFILGH